MQRNESRKRSEGTVAVTQYRDRDDPYLRYEVRRFINRQLRAFICKGEPRAREVGLRWYALSMEKFLKMERDGKVIPLSIK